jgi:TonB family protein
VAGAKASRGAAIGCKRFCGTPILVPGDESWGTSEQLAALAGALEGERADPVTGYIVRPSPDGEVRFDAVVYPGETVLSMELEARMPAESGGAHELALRLSGIEPDAPALAEARLLVHAERTVAIAAPSPVEGEWVVLAVTPMDPDSVRARIAKVEEVRTLDSRATIEPPTLVHREVPRYPEVARRDVRSGRVVLEAIIDREGVPRAIKVLRIPEGCEDLAAASVDSVGRWRYEPATLDGQPVPVFFTVVFQFVLE